MTTTSISDELLPMAANAGRSCAQLFSLRLAGWLFSHLETPFQSGANQIDSQLAKAGIAS